MFTRFRRRVVRKIKGFFSSKEQRQTRKQVREIETKVKKCGCNLQVFGDVEITYPDKLVIGEDCRLNNQVYINARSSVVIGDDVTISHGAKIISTGYDLEHWIHTNKKKHIEDKPIYIGNHCWIGAGAIILPGVQITGEYVVVAAGAIVTKNINDSKVVLAGNPAKIVRKI